VSRAAATRRETKNGWTDQPFSSNPFIIGIEHRDGPAIPSSTIVATDEYICRSVWCHSQAIVGTSSTPPTWELKKTIDITAPG
jgi:hypothetical protein